MPEQVTHDDCVVDLKSHPAVRAWSKRRPEGPVPTGITALKVRRKASQKPDVYRLYGVGPEGSNVIATRCRGDRALVERTILAKILPRLAVPALQLYDFAEESGGEWCWLFMEDAGNEKYSYSSGAQAGLAARWLACLHTSATAVAAAELPDRGPAHYLEHLRAAGVRIVANLSSPSLSTEDRTVLQGIVRLCDTLESLWDRIESMLDPMPRTLVHGDFTRKNIRVRAGPQGQSLIVLDWEMAGWGPPAVDLYTFPLNGASPPGGDAPLDVYASTVRPFWPGLDRSDIECMAHVGVVFRTLAAIRWACESLGYAYVAKAMNDLRCYERRLAEALGAMDWERVSCR